MSLRIEKKIRPGLCRCCGELTVYRILNETYINSHLRGKIEIYSDMIDYCFGIQFSGLGPECEVQSKVICAPCVIKLRDACTFKKQVEASEEKFIRQKGLPEVLKKSKPYWTKTHVLETRPAPCKECELRKSKEKEEQEKKNENKDGMVEHMHTKVRRRKQNNRNKADISSNTESETDTSIPVENTLRKTTKLQELTRNINILRKPAAKSQPKLLYTPIAPKPVESTIKDLNITPDIEGIFIVKQDSLQTEVMEAEVAENPIPDNKPEKVEISSDTEIEIKEENEEEMIVETLDSDFEDENDAIDDDDEENNPTSNAKLIITNSYVVPFYRSTVRVRCYYCEKYYPDYGQLREHILEHSIDYFKHKGEEFIRIDITRIDCRLCPTKIDSLSTLVSHLHTFHRERKMSMARSGVLPYLLEQNLLHCVVCGLKFTSFLDLDDHMEKHFTDHVCSACNNVYLDEPSLQAHLAAIDSSTNACEVCHKYFKDATTLRAHHKELHEEEEVSDWSAENDLHSDDIESDPPVSDEELYRKRSRPKKKSKTKQQENKPNSQTHFSDLDDDGGLEDIWDEHFKNLDQDTSQNLGETTSQHLGENNGLSLGENNGHSSSGIAVQHLGGNSDQSLGENKVQSLGEMTGQLLGEIKVHSLGEMAGQNLGENSCKSLEDSNSDLEEKAGQTLEEKRKRGRPRKNIPIQNQKEITVGEKRKRGRPRKNNDTTPNPRTVIQLPNKLEIEENQGVLRKLLISKNSNLGYT